MAQTDHPSGSERAQQSMWDRAYQAVREARDKDATIDPEPFKKLMKSAGGKWRSSPFRLSIPVSEPEPSSSHAPGTPESPVRFPGERCHC